MIAQYHPTPSQEAAAAMHLDRQSEWRTVRIGGTRYVVLPSGRSNRVYHVLASGDRCDCRWSQTQRTPCSHRLAVERAALLDEQIEEIDAAIAEACVPLKSLRDLYPGCAGGCGSIVEARDGLWCDDCAAKRERAERMAAARRRVVEAWV